MGVAVYSLYVDCDFPRWMSWALILYMVSFLVLFGNFYLQAYIKGKSKKSVSFQDKTRTEKHLQNGAMQNDVTPNGVTQNGTPYALRKRMRKD